MDCEGESSIGQQVLMKAVVDSLSNETDENVIEFEKRVDEGVDASNLVKKYPCGLCSTVCKSKAGLTLHTRAKHRDRTPVTKSISPIDAQIVSEIVSQAEKSVVKSKLYGDSVTKLISEAELKPSELLVESLLSLYEEYCERLDKDKLLKNFYRHMLKSAEMFTTNSQQMYPAAYNLIMVHIPDLLVGFYKRGNVKEKLPNIKPIEKSEYGPLSYVAILHNFEDVS